jgi:molecular chaperone GrpE
MREMTEHRFEPGTADAEAENPQSQSAAEPAADRSDASSEDSLEALQRQANESREQLLRLAAELDNVRKRAVRDVENARKYGLERLAQALLPVRDSLEAGLAAGATTDPEALLEGKRATLRLLDSALEQVGVTDVDPEGEPFNPEYHEALTIQPSATAEPNTVLTVIQKGYAIHDRLLRPARVIVAGAPGSEPTD